MKGSLILGLRKNLSGYLQDLFVAKITENLNSTVFQLPRPIHHYLEHAALQISSSESVPTVSICRHKIEIGGGGGFRPNF